MKRKEENKIVNIMKKLSHYHEISVIYFLFCFLD